MNRPDDSHVGPDAPAGPDPSAAPETLPTPEPPAVPLVPPPPVPLWPGELAAARRVGSAEARARFDAALSATRSRLAAVEAGSSPADPPPATLDAFEAMLADATAPLLEASVDPAAAAPARDALAAGLLGWSLSVLASRLAVAARRHGRSLVPRSLTEAVADFADRHVASARTGHGIDPAFHRQSLLPVRTICDRAWERLAASAAALEATDPAAAPAVLGLLEHARARLVRIEQWHYETCVADPGPGGRASLMIALRTRRSRPRWQAPAGIPPRPVIDDISPPRPGHDDAGPADESARSGDAA